MIIHVLYCKHRKWLDLFLFGFSVNSQDPMERKINVCLIILQKGTANYLQTKI